MRFLIKLIDNCAKTCMNKTFFHTSVTLHVEKKEMLVVSPYLDMSLVLRTWLRKSFNKNLPFCKIRVIFKPSMLFSIFLQFKDKASIN